MDKGWNISNLLGNMGLYSLFKCEMGGKQA